MRSYRVQKGDQHCQDKERRELGTIANRCREESREFTDGEVDRVWLLREKLKDKATRAGHFDHTPKTPIRNAQELSEWASKPFDPPVLTPEPRRQTKAAF